jgi:hypothetical protein
MQVPLGSHQLHMHQPVSQAVFTRQMLQKLLQLVSSLQADKVVSRVLRFQQVQLVYQQ